MNDNNNKMNNSAGHVSKNCIKSHFHIVQNTDGNVYRSRFKGRATLYSRSLRKGRRFPSTGTRAHFPSLSLIIKAERCSQRETRWNTSLLHKRDSQRESHHDVTPSNADCQAHSKPRSRRDRHERKTQDVVRQAGFLSDKQLCHMDTIYLIDV